MTLRLYACVSAFVCVFRCVLEGTFLVSACVCVCVCVCVFVLVSVRRCSCMF